MYENLPKGQKFPELFNAVIEIPKGSHNKYEFDEELKVIKLDRVLYSPFYYPVDYGFIPETRAEDGDHLDALVLSSDPLAFGVLVEVRPIALLKMTDSGEPDSKVLSVVNSDPRFRHVKSIEDVAPHLLKEIAHFFETYKELEGKKVEISGWEDKEAALRTLKRCAERYALKHS